MNLLQSIIENPVFTRLGWVLLHSIWQVAAMALLLAVVLSVCRKHGARASYSACCAALLLTIVLPAITFFLVPGHSDTGASPTETEVNLRLNATLGDASPLREGPEGDEIAFKRSIREVGNRSQPRANDAEIAPTPSPVPATEVITSFGRQLSASSASWLPWVALVWLLGVAVLSLWNVGGWLSVQLLKTRGTCAVSLGIQEAAVRMARQMSLNRSVRLLGSTIVDSPLVLGAIKPLILLPASLLCQLPPDQLESLLAHELAHILRQDYFINLLQCAIETLLFYHPAVWWISAQTRVQREYCCDDIAVGLTSNRTVYVKALAAVAGARASLLAPAASGGQLLPRLQRLLGATSPRRSHPSRWLTGAAALALCATLLALLTVRSHSAIAQAPAKSDADKAAAAEERAIQAVLKAGGSVQRDANEKSNPVTSVFLGRGQIGMRDKTAVTDATLKDLKELKSLKNLRLNGAAVTDAGMAYLKDIASLQSLTLNKTQITDVGLNDLKGLKNLQQFYLEDTGVTDAGLKGIKELQKLQTLDLKSTKVTDVGLKELKELENLRMLSISGAQVTDVGLKALKELKSLENLNLSEPKALDSGLNDIQELKSLRTLMLNGPQVTDVSLANLKEQNGITTLILSETDVTNEGLKNLKKLTGLHTLQLSGTLVSDEGLKELIELKHLQTLGLHRLAVTDAGLPHLIVLTNLQTLTLDGTSVTSAGLDLLRTALPNCNVRNVGRPADAPGRRGAPVSSEKQAAVVKSLEKLGGRIAGTRSLGRVTMTSAIFQGYQLTDAALKDVKELTTLQELRLDQTSVTDTGLRDLVGLTNLHRLSLDGASVTDAGLKYLKGLTNLQTLNLRNTKVTDAALNDLKGFRNLEGLNLGFTKVTEQTVKELQQALAQCLIVGPGPTGPRDEVRPLRLPALGAAGGRRRPPTERPPAPVKAAPKPVGNESPAMLAFQKLGANVVRDGKAEGNPVVSIYFLVVGVTDADLKHIEEFKSVERIELRGAGITNEGLHELKQLKNLKSLRLINTSVTDTGLRELEDLEKLQGLVLEGTRMTGAGLRELKNTTNLTSLVLGGARIADSGLKSLRELKNLESLRFHFTSVTNEGLGELADLKNLKTLYLGGTQITGAGLRQLKNLTKLETLDLSHAEVADVGLDYLADLPNLRTLHLDHTKVTDAGLVELKKLTNLQTLDLNRTLITDAGLKELRDLKKLKSLILSNSGVTAAGAKKLHEDLPDCQIQAPGGLLRKKEL